MKNKYYLALIMLFFAFIAKGNSEFGDSFTVNGITYVVISSNNKKEVKVGSNPAANGVVSIPSIVTNGEEDFDVVEIGGMAFDHCKKLKKILLPSGLKVIGILSFGETGIRSVDLPSGIKEIKKGAFSGSSLESIIMPSELFQIGEHAFMSCKNLKQVILNNGITCIGRWAFLYTKLKQISLPASIKEIGVSAFPDGMREVQCNATVPPVIKKMTFSEETYEKGTLLVPFNSIDAYRVHEFWGQFKNIKAL